MLFTKVESSLSLLGRVKFNFQSMSFFSSEHSTLFQQSFIRWSVKTGNLYDWSAILLHVQNLTQQVYRVDLLLQLLIQTKTKQPSREADQAFPWSPPTGGSSAGRPVCPIGQPFMLLCNSGYHILPLSSLLSELGNFYFHLVNRSYN